MKYWINYYHFFIFKSCFFKCFLDDEYSSYFCSLWLLDLLLSLFFWYWLSQTDRFCLLFFLLFLKWMLLDLLHCWIKLKTLYPLTKVKTIQVIECHQVTITTKNVHKIILNTNCLPISCTWFLTNYFSVCFVIYDLLFLLLFGWLLVTWN